MPLNTRVRGSGPELFMIHGWAMSSAVWDDVVDKLALHFRVTCVDLPGHGASPVEVAFELDGVVDALFEVAPEQAVWIGWSLGGMLALEAALQRPERIESLVLLAASARFVAGDDWPHAMPVDVLNAFFKALEDDREQTLKRFFSLVARDADDAPQVLRQLRALLQNTPQAIALVGGLGLLRDMDLRARVAGLTKKTLLLAGARDKIVPLKAVEALASTIVNSELIVVDGAGHAPLLSHPEFVVESIEQWLM